MRADPQTLISRIEIREKDLGKEHFELVPDLIELADALHYLGQYVEAEQVYKRALDIQEKETDESPAESIILTCHRLGVHLRIQEKFEEAEFYYKKALGIANRRYSSEAPETVRLSNYLAGLCFASERFEQAAALVEHSLKVYEKTPSQPDATSMARMALVLIYSRLGKAGKAQALFQKVQSQFSSAPRREVLGEFKDLAHSLLDLARESFRNGKSDDAEILFRYSLIIETERLWPGHRLVADNLQLLADLYRAQHMNPEAEFLYRRALLFRRDVLPERHLDIAVTSHALGTLLLETKRAEDAELLLREAVEIRSQAGFPPLHAKSLTAYANVLEQLGRNEQAAERRLQAEKILSGYNPTTQTG